MLYLINLVLLFFFYSFLGWCVEVTLKYIQYHRFINRGFFTGPICPIYGTGAALITLVVGGLGPVEKGYGITFLASFLLCGAVEYFTSYFMEKRFHARWWDYSQKPMNLHGRIWIGNLILFGLGGVAIIHIINPPLFRLFERLSLQTREIIDAALLCVFAADYAVTHFVLKLVKSGIERSEADNTEEINREIRVLLSDRNIFYRRFADAYPEVRPTGSDQGRNGKNPPGGGGTYHRAHGTNSHDQECHHRKAGRADRYAVRRNDGHRGNEAGQA